MNTLQSKRLTRDVLVLLLVGGMLNYLVKKALFYLSIQSNYLSFGLELVAGIITFTLIGSLDRRPRRNRLIAMLLAGVVLWPIWLINFFLFPWRQVILVIFKGTVLLFLSAFIGWRISLLVAPCMSEVEKALKPQQGRSD